MNSSDQAQLTHSFVSSKLALMGAVAILTAIAVLVTGALVTATQPVEAQIPPVSDDCNPSTLPADWRICIVKVADPDDTGTVFDFEWEFGQLGDTFSLEHAEGEMIEVLGFGEMTVSEVDLQDGWELVNVDCFLNSGLADWQYSTNIGDDGGTVTLELNTVEQIPLIVCLFYNEQDEDPDPTSTPPHDRRPPNIAGALGAAVIGGNQLAPTPTAVAPAQPTQAPRPISPPSTGSGGLK